MHWTPPPLKGYQVMAQPLSYVPQVSALTAFVTDSNRGRYWDIGNMRWYLAHLLGAAPLSRLSRNAFWCMYGPACTPQAEPHFAVALGVLEDLRSHHQLGHSGARPGSPHA